MQGQYQCAKYCFDCRQFAFLHLGQLETFNHPDSLWHSQFYFWQVFTKHNTCTKTQKHFPHFTNPILHN